MALPGFWLLVIFSFQHDPLHHNTFINRKKKVFYGCASEGQDSACPAKLVAGASGRARGPIRLLDPCTHGMMPTPPDPAGEQVPVRLRAGMEGPKLLSLATDPAGTPAVPTGRALLPCRSLSPAPSPAQCPAGSTALPSGLRSIPAPAVPVWLMQHGLSPPARQVR